MNVYNISVALIELLFQLKFPVSVNFAQYHQNKNEVIQ